MANKKTRVTYGGINQDVAKSRVQDSMYYDANNIKLTPIEGQALGTLSNAYGNLLSLTLPRPWVDVAAGVIRYGDQQLPYTSRELENIAPVSGKQSIIGHIETINGAVLFSTDETLDCVWEVVDLDKDELEINLLYMREMGFTIDNPIQAIFNYENELIQKVYWVDGTNYLRFLNITQSVANGFESELIDIPVASVNSKSTIDISKPVIEDGGGGGVHTAGMIQYAYTLYNLNGAETSLSPLSDLFPLDKGIGNGGGAVNEVVGSMPVVVIEDVDEKYDYLKLYSVKYTEYNGTPSINLIYDGSVGNYVRFTYNDTGTSSLGALDIATFLFLGADPIKPSHIVSKDNYLFASNNISTAYKLDIDTRAYSYDKTGLKAEIFNNVVYDASKGEIPYTGTKWDVATQGYGVPEDFDAVNLNFDTYRYRDTGIAGSPGRVIVDSGTIVTAIERDEPVEIFAGGTGSLTLDMTSTCDPGNTVPKVYDLVIPPIGGTNNRVLATKTAKVQVGLYGELDFTVAGNRVVTSSYTPQVEVYANATATTPLRTYEMTVRPVPLVNKDIFQVVADLNAGEYFKTVFKLRSHYSNDTCVYQAYDVNASGGYEGDGPYQGPDETGLSDTLTVEFDYSLFTARYVESLDKYTPVPLTATSGETNVIDGKYVADYTGSIDAVVQVTVDSNGILVNPTDVFKLSVLRNGSVVNSSPLNLTSPGLNVFNFTPRFSVSFGDEIEFVLEYAEPSGLVFYPIDINLSGEVTLNEGVSSGSNGEGGTGRYLSYTLERTELDALDISLRQARFFKDNEIYRIGIVFWNSIGQASEAKWIADFKAPQGNLEGQFNTLRVEFTTDFYTWLNSLPEEERPTNYGIVRAIRRSTDKTIISQGIMSGMFVQDFSSNPETSNTYEKKSGKNPGLVKTPIPITRGYGSGVSENNSYYPVFPTNHNYTMNESASQLDSSRGDGDQDPRTSIPRDFIVDEIYRDRAGDYKRQQSWQYTKMMQMYSPEATFGFQISTTDKDELHLLGYMPRKEYNVWDYNVDVETFGPHLSNKKEFNYGTPANFYPYLTGGFGVIGPSYRRWKSGTERVEYGGYETQTVAKHARRTHFRKTFLPLERASRELKYDILNRPEITEVGQGITSYNSDKGLQYINKLTLTVSDEKRPTNDSLLGTGGSAAAAIKAVQSEGNRCLTIVLGDNQQDHESRTGLDDLYRAVGTGEWDVELFGEIRKTKNYVYSGALYGGYDVSSRSRTEYVSIGDVYDINEGTAVIKSPGDTYVQTFKNTRLTKVPGTVYTTDVQTIVETLEYVVETTINLEERNDISISSWDSVVDPTAEEGTAYNRVYSTDTTIQTFSSDSLKLRNVERKEVEIIASKPKIPGEFVDNWVDFQPNEVQYLDGKYGPISNVVNHWDQLYAFQDFAVAKVAVNPRVQVQGLDNVSIQLGTGQVLHDYQYLTTKSGSLNKWGIASTNSGLYYLDANLKQLQRIQPGQGIEGVSEAKGLHSFLQNNIDRDSVEIDNPLTGDGTVIGYDIVNGDIFTTVLKDGESFTVSFNEKTNSFTSFYDFIPTRYIVKGERMFTVPAGNEEMWVHSNNAEYQNWYGTKYGADITLLINTDVPGMEKVFNSIEFDSEVTLEDVDVPASTIDSIEAWTTYQKSGKIDLVYGANIKRKFRTWRAFIPRQEASRNRLRDKWLFLKLGFNPEDNEKLILHDIIINYSA